MHNYNDFMCRYGMETFSQYCVNGCFNYTKLSIQDHPQYKHRGLMIDAGYV